MDQTENIHAVIEVVSSNSGHPWAGLGLLEVVWGLEGYVKSGVRGGKTFNFISAATESYLLI